MPTLDRNNALFSTLRPSAARLVQECCLATPLRVVLFYTQVMRMSHADAHRALRHSLGMFGVFIATNCIVDICNRASLKAFSMLYSWVSKKGGTMRPWQRRGANTFLRILQLFCGLLPEVRNMATNRMLFLLAKSRNNNNNNNFSYLHIMLTLMSRQGDVSMANHVLSMLKLIATIQLHRTCIQTAKNGLQQSFFMSMADRLTSILNMVLIQVNDTNNNTKAMRQSILSNIALMVSFPASTLVNYAAMAAMASRHSLSLAKACSEIWARDKYGLHHGLTYAILASIT
eukprot:PhM_4_TR3595/c0_g1_i1/m.67563